MVNKTYESTASSIDQFVDWVDDDPTKDFKPSDYFGTIFSSLVQKKSFAGPSDWNELDNGYSPIIQDQNGWNSCVSCSLVSALQSRNYRARQNMIDLSPGYLHYCLLGNNKPEMGSNFTTAAREASKSGIAISSDIDFPVNAKICQSNDKVHVKTGGWVLGPDAILTTLVQDGPLMTTVKISNRFVEHDGPSIYEDNVGEEYLGAHAVLLIGFNLADRYVIVQNSMGKDWGIKGIGKIRIGAGDILTINSGFVVNPI